MTHLRADDTRPVRIGDILELKRRWLRPETHTPYVQIGVRSFGKGIFHKPPVSGIELGNKRVLCVEPGDLVFNNVFAWEGAVAVARDSESGTIGSHRYVTLVPKRENLCDVRFLQLYFSSEEGLDIVRRASPGSAGRNRTLGIDRLLNEQIYIPAITRQREIVAIIDKVRERTAEVVSLQLEVERQNADVCRSMLWHAHTTPTRMSELVALRTPDILVRGEDEYQFAGVYSFGRGLFRAQSRSGMETSYQRLTRLRTGDLVYPKLMAWEGAFGIVPPECDGCVVSTEFPVFEARGVIPEVLDVHFRTPSVWAEIAGISTGTNVRRRRLHPERFLDYLFPLPDEETQHRIRDAHRLVDAMHLIHEVTSDELTMLDKSLIHHTLNSRDATHASACLREAKSSHVSRRLRRRS